MKNYTKAGAPRFTFYNPLTKTFWSKELSNETKEFEKATIWKEPVGAEPVKHWILEDNEPETTWEDALRTRYHIPASFKKIMVAVHFSINSL